MIFVFGSNLKGIHGAGAARTAIVKYGANYGQGFGQQGQSFAIPTKNFNLNTLPLREIRRYVQNFIHFTYYIEELQPQETFLVTRIGCGLAGYKDEDIAPLFVFAPQNCIMPIQWKPWMQSPSFYRYHDEGKLL